MTRSIPTVTKTALTGLALALTLGAIAPGASAQGLDPADRDRTKRLFAEARERNKARGDSGPSFFSRLFGGDKMEVSEAAKGKDAEKTAQ